MRLGAGKCPNEVDLLVGPADPARKYSLGHRKYASKVLEMRAVSAAFIRSVFDLETSTVILNGAGREHVMQAVTFALGTLLPPISGVGSKTSQVIEKGAWA